ncbi:MAG TPA: hypothetical protein VN108_06080 [Marmoricola sp.]|nr:hypothetical protein [Marmoricola sp.]
MSLMVTGSRSVAVVLLVLAVLALSAAVADTTPPTRAPPTAKAKTPTAAVTQGRRRGTIL